MAYNPLAQTKPQKKPQKTQSVIVLHKNIQTTPGTGNNPAPATVDALTDAEIKAILDTIF